MSRYREAPKKIPEPTTTIVFPAKGSKKTINYIWMPDKDGNLIKKDSSIVKKSFANLSKEAQRALAQYVIAVQNRQPTDAARQSVFNDLIAAAEGLYKEGKKQTPWDVLSNQIANAPKLTDTSVTYTNYDKITSDALLQKAAKDLGFTMGSFAQFGEQDLADFFEKLTEASKAGAKQTQVVVRPDGTQETIITPASFDAASFARNYLWAKVNIGDPKTLPTTVIDSIDSLKTVLKRNGLGYLSDKEIANYAVQLGKGEVDLASLQKQFNAKAAELYPQFADRLKANPSLTVMDVVEPYVNLMAKWWEIDPNTVDLDNPDLDKFIRPDGTAGKVPMGSLADFTNYLKNHPNAEKTSWANDAARDLATGFARIAGYGV
jgi:DNA polymerase I-like protein with 3'-5' exonuclease and polymerase domains